MFLFALPSSAMRSPAPTCTAPALTETDLTETDLHCACRVYGDRGSASRAAHDHVAPTPNARLFPAA
jgi:hypothetical protein